MLNRKRKLLSVLLFALLIFSVFALPALALEIKYPTFGGQTVGKETTLPQYVKYIFNFSIGIAGILAFGVLIWGGVLIILSAGEPAKITEGRNKIIGAFVGAILILSTYLILTTINPDLKFLTTQPIQPTAGLYLIKQDGSKTYLDQDTPSLKEDSNNPYTSIEFVAKADDLTAVYVYPEDGYQGDAEKIDNSGGTSPITISPKKSIRLLWNKPGVYLYSQTDFNGNPLYIQANTSNLSQYNFDDKARSIQIKDDTKNNISYGAIVFTYPDYRGRCGYVMGDINDLSAQNGNLIEFENILGFDTISSLAILNKTTETAGDVTFYDSIDCKGCKMKLSIDGYRYFPNFDIIDPAYKEFICDDGSKKPVDKNIISFEINGNFGVVLNNSKYFGGPGPTNGGGKYNPNAKCELFLKPAGTNCVPTIKGSYIYDPDFYGDKVRSLMIIPLAH